MYFYLWMTDASSEAQRAIAQFQKYMRSRDPADAPFLFDNPRPPLSDTGTEHPLEFVLRFAYGYRDIIIADNAQINTMTADNGRWVLDLSASALWSYLNHWGRTGKLLSVQCDESKPLEAITAKFTGDENDPAIRRARANHSPGTAVGWKLAEPVAFVDSRDHPAVQLADVIAGTAMALFANGLPGSEAIAESIGRHGHPHSILPDMDIIDPANRSAAVNALIVYDLAKRAERHGDPYENLEDDVPRGRSQLGAWRLRAHQESQGTEIRQDCREQVIKTPKSRKSCLYVLLSPFATQARPPAVSGRRKGA